MLVLLICVSLIIPYKHRPFHVNANFTAAFLETFVEDHFVIKGWEPLSKILLLLIITANNRVLRAILLSILLLIFQMRQIIDVSLKVLRLNLVLVLALRQIFMQVLRDLSQVLRVGLKQGS